MGTRKKGSELVFNLQWRHKADNGGDKSNVIGMCDTQTSTSNLEMFKSYLLKNSGVAGNDVEVTYVTDNGQEWLIDCQELFQVALSSFRLKARLAEVIFLKLDEISKRKPQIQMSRKHSNDVETQFDVDSMENNAAGPPEWFLTSMKQFKTDIVEEVKYALLWNLPPNPQEKEPMPATGITISSNKKPKPELPKRARKHMGLGENPIDKELLKTLKYDRKLENKLDKLDAKTKKIKEKKQALINRIENEEQRNFGNIPAPDEEVAVPEYPFGNKCVPAGATDFVNKDVHGNALLDASSKNANSFDRMTGGEIFLRTWEITNTGKLPWSTNTEVRLDWGSAYLVPSTRAVRCPALKPGETGTIAIRFNIPKKPGCYESYWNFYDKGIRFGTYLRCSVIVEEPLTVLNNFALHDDKDIEAKQTLKTVASAASSEQEKTKKKIEIKKTPGGFPRNIPRVYSAPTPYDSWACFKYPECLPHAQEMCDAMMLGTERPKQQPNGDFKVISAATYSELAKKGFYPNLMEFSNLDQQSNNSTHNKDDLDFFSKHCSPCHKPPVRIQVPMANPFANLPSAPPQFEKSADSFSLLENLKQAENILVNPDSVIDLSTRMEGIKLETNADSDSDWESVCSYGKKRGDDDITADSTRRTSNKYGINEKDLIVDLSTTAKTFKEENKVENVENEDSKQIAEANFNEDNNNNIGNVDNNNSVESISEIASDASSDVSSGYDVLQVPNLDEKEDDVSGYVYITIDGNKLPVPRHILRPDFLASAEEAPCPLNSMDYKTVENKITSEENAEQACAIEKPDQVSKSESKNRDRKADEDDISSYDIKAEEMVSNLLDSCKEENGKPTKEKCDESMGSCNTHCSAAGSCFSETAENKRLFIFPQKHPGYEVFRNIESTAESAMEDKAYFDWRKSPSGYCYMSQSPQPTRSAPFHTPSPSLATVLPPPNPTYTHESGRGPILCPTQESGFRYPPTYPMYGHYYPPMPSACSSSFENEDPGLIFIQKYPRTPNYQQSPPKPSGTSTPNVTPSSPTPQPSSDRASVSSGVHILPENLVNGAVNVATSAINTARSVINMISSQPKKEELQAPGWYWVPQEASETLRANNLCILNEMGFPNTELNNRLLARHDEDIDKVISQLLS